MTGGAAKVMKDDLDFVDSGVSNLAVRGVVIAYKKYLADESQLAELGDKSRKKKKK